MAQSLQDRMLTMLSDDILTDVTFIVEGVEIKGHRALIASYGGLLRDLIEKNTQRVDLGDMITLESFKTVIRYIYTDKVEFTQSNWFDLLHASTTFHLEHLEQLCVNHFLNIISPTNLGELTKQAKLFNSKELLKECLKYFGNHTNKILTSKAFLDFSEDILITLCDADRNDCSEVVLFCSCVQWARNKCRIASLEETPENLREKLGDTLNKIHFSSMKMNEFLQNVVQTRLLTNSQVGEIIFEIQQNEEKSMSSNSGTTVKASSASQQEIPLMMYAQNPQSQEPCVANLGNTGFIGHPTGSANNYQQCDTDILTCDYCGNEFLADTGDGHSLCDDCMPRYCGNCGSKFFADSGDGDSLCDYCMPRYCGNCGSKFFADSGDGDSRCDDCMQRYCEICGSEFSADSGDGYSLCDDCM